MTPKPPEFPTLPDKYSDLPADRRLTDADISALADALEVKVVDRFYTNLGKGLWGFAWKGFIIAALALCAYGAGKGWKV